MGLESPYATVGGAAAGGATSFSVSQAGTAQAVAQIAQRRHVISNNPSNICYVAIGAIEQVTINTATALPIPAASTIKVAIGPGSHWPAAQLNGGTGLLSVVEVPL